MQLLVRHPGHSRLDRKNLIMISMRFLKRIRNKKIRLIAESCCFNQFLYLAYNLIHQLTLKIFAMFLQKAKGTHNAIEIVNPNLVKPKSMKSQDADVSD